jgi:hypothetical protein
LLSRMPTWAEMGGMGGSFLGRLSRQGSGREGASGNRDKPDRAPEESGDEMADASNNSPTIHLADSTTADEEEGLKSAKELVEEAWKMSRGVRAPPQPLRTRPQSEWTCRAAEAQPCAYKGARHVPLQARERE